jgi:hypothetical protein
MEVPLPEEWELELKGALLGPEAIQVYLAAVTVCQVLSGNPVFVAYRLSDLIQPKSEMAKGLGADRFTQVVSRRIESAIPQDIFKDINYRQTCVEILQRCLSFSPEGRPTLSELHQVMVSLSGGDVF